MQKPRNVALLGSTVSILTDDMLLSSSSTIARSHPDATASHGTGDGADGVKPCRVVDSSLHPARLFVVSRRASIHCVAPRCLLCPVNEEDERTVMAKPWNCFYVRDHRDAPAPCCDT